MQVEYPFDLISYLIQTDVCWFGRKVRPRPIKMAGVQTAAGGRIILCETVEAAKNAQTKDNQD